jgi:hypothetical protein
MQDVLQRARLRPGPLLAIALVWFTLTTTVVRAHDPGLSSLDVSVSGAAIAVSLSLAAADLPPVAPGPEADTSRQLSELARGVIRVSVDGETLRPVTDVVSVDGGGARIVLTYTIPHSSRQSSHLTIASAVPKRLTRGHRELLIVTVAGRVAAESLLDEKSDSATVDLGVVSASPLRRAWSFLAIGVGHILTGYDHLVFLAGLILAARRAKELVFALTAFTVAHSVSLALVVFGGLHAPASIVEPLIAASIAWIGVENARGRGAQSRTATCQEQQEKGRRGGVGHKDRVRTLVVFGFGLIHGLGFAAALMELGFGSSPGDIALALVSFNAGVEAGQLAAAAAVLPVVWMVRSRPTLEARLLPACSLLIAIAGGWWLIERLG